MADVFTVLALDHAEVRAMLAELDTGLTKATGANRDQLDLRKRMAQALIIEESRHEAVEEMYFWPAVRGHHAAGNTLADEANAQEQQAKQILAELDRLEADDARFEALLGMFIRAARKHIEFEETQV
jgi:Hemerythrin HHE cation binding domain